MTDNTTSGLRVLGWKLSSPSRSRLLAQFPPRHANVVADHVTLQAFPPAGSVPPPAVSTAKVVGHADDPGGVEVLVVAIDGSTTRPDGGIWHVTWSLADGRRARESNDVLARDGWRACDGGIVDLIPAVW